MVAVVFSSISALAIVIGGLLSAFTARRPTRVTAWASAYLVLVAGSMQLGLVAAWQQLGRPEATLVLLALLAFNLGNIAVMIGTVRKRQLQYYRLLVDGGGVCIALAMALLLTAIRTVPVSGLLIAFIGLVVIILVSMPIGLMLSARRHRALGHGDNEPADTMSA